MMYNEWALSFSAMRDETRSSPRGLNPSRGTFFVFQINPNRSIISTNRGNWL